MSSSKIIHEAAMEYYDLAKTAKIKGDLTAYKEQLEKAYFLEKEAALTMPEQPHNFMWRYILLRSAGWLAFHCGYYEDAKKLADIGLAGNAPPHEMPQLEELAKVASKQIKKSIQSAEPDDILNFSGIFTAADIIENQIIVQVHGKPYLLAVDNDKIREVARLFLGDIVQVKARKNRSGIASLHRIARAA